MAEPPATAYCPDCGAPIRAENKQCWLCVRPIQWDGGTVDIRVNPIVVAEAVPPAPTYRYETNSRAMLGVVLAALAMGPAALVACFVTCAVTWGPYQWPEDKAIWGSLISGMVVIVAFLVLIGVLSTRVTRKVVW